MDDLVKVCQMQMQILHYIVPLFGYITTVRI